MSLFSWFGGSSGPPCPSCGASLKSALAVVCGSCHKLVPFPQDQEREFAEYIDSLVQRQRAIAQRYAAEGEGKQPNIGPLNGAELTAIRQVFGATARAQRAGKPLRVLLTLPPEARKAVVAFVGTLPLITELLHGKELEIVYVACDGPTKARASNTHFDYGVDCLALKRGFLVQPVPFIFWDDISKLLSRGPVYDKLLVIGDVDRHPTTIPRAELESPAIGSFSIFASNLRQNMLLMHTTDRTSPFGLRFLGKVER